LYLKDGQSQDETKNLEELLIKISTYALNYCINVFIKKSKTCQQLSCLLPVASCPVHKTNHLAVTTETVVLRQSLEHQHETTVPLCTMVQTSLLSRTEHILGSCMWTDNLYLPEIQLLHCATAGSCCDHHSCTLHQTVAVSRLQHHHQLPPCQCLLFCRMGIFLHT